MVTYSHAESHAYCCPRLQHNKCLQVLLTEDNIFVVRAHVVEVYPNPTLLPPPLDANSIVRPISQFSFGWIDGVSVVPQISAPTSPGDTSPASADKQLPSISIVLRSEMDDPWSSDTSKIELYTLSSSPFPQAHSSRSPVPIHTNADFLAEFLSDLHLDDIPKDSQPYTQHPTLITSLAHTPNNGRRTLRCPTILSGKFGTSIWIQPPQVVRSRREVGLVAFDVHSSQTQGIDDVHPFADTDDVFPVAKSKTAQSEVLVGALLPGPLLTNARKRACDATADSGEYPIHNANHDFGRRDICTPFSSSSPTMDTNSRYWMSMDYAEEWGRIVLGCSDGTVTFIEL